MGFLEAFPLDLLKATVALFVIVDPLGPVPIFANITKGMDHAEKRQVFRTAAIVGAGLLARLGGPGASSIVQHFPSEFSDRGRPCSAIVVD